MFIKCYLYSNRTRQINHKYYSLSTDRNIRLFQDLKQDTAYFERLENKAFVYEVEVEHEDVIECTYSYLRATAFRIKHRVDFRTVANEMSIVTQTINKINSILDGNIEEEELFALYKKYMAKRPFSLSHSEQMKFLAILNQTKYELPCLTPHYFVQIRLLEDCNIPYSLPESYKSSDWVRETLLGSSYFENYRLSIKKFKSVSEISLLIQTRKLTQSQFEEITRNKQEIVKNTSLGEIAVAAGYKIPNKYLNIFYPNISHLDLDDIGALIANWNIDTSISTKFLENNYMIEGFDYSNKECQKIIEAKKIFLKDDFKIIERQALC